MVQGYYDLDTIEFTVFDHYYGERNFSEWLKVLLFVIFIDGQAYHEKYLVLFAYWDFHNQTFIPANIKDCIVFKQ